MQGLAFLKEGRDATEQIRTNADAYWKTFLDQATAKKYEALAEKQHAQECLQEVEATMAKSRKELEDRLRKFMASAEEQRLKVVAEKDAAVAELTQAMGKQSAELLSATRELEQLRAEVEGFKESTRARTVALAATEAERDAHKMRLQQEKSRAEELQCLVDVWSRRESTLPQTVVAKYVQSAEFGSFVDRLTMGAFRMGALEFREAVLHTHPPSTVEAADEEVPALLAEATLSTVPPPPRFELSPADLDRPVDPQVFKDPPEASEEGEDGKEEAIGEEMTTGTEGIPPDEPSLLDVLADDPTDFS